MTRNTRAIRRILVRDDEPFDIPADGVVLTCESSEGRIIVYFLYRPTEDDDK